LVSLPTAAFAGETMAEVARSALVARGVAK
jgi:hypothetical protein